MIDAHVLNKALNKAKANEQIGLFLWANAEQYIEAGINPDTPDYKQTLYEIKHGNIGYVTSMLGGGIYSQCYMGVPVAEMKSSTELYNKALAFCQIKNFEGPITLIPSNETYFPDEL